ncbi:MAG: hypothetical protein ACXWYJ_10570 [Actinomycetota bacterium]
MKARWVVLLVIALPLPACADPAPDAPTTVGRATLLTHEATGDGAYMSALGGGRLVVRDGCVAMRAEGGGPATFILWDAGYGLREREGVVEVVDPDGDLVAAIGSPIMLGGGFVDLEVADDQVEAPIPEACRDDGLEPYFLAAPDAWPFAEADGITLLRNTGTELSGDEALIEGTLSIVGGCIALDVDGPWLVWPVDYGLSANEPLEVWDGRQRRVAEIGDRVKLGGGIGTMPDPTSMPGGIPDGCRGDGESYWYVGEIEVVP